MYFAVCNKFCGNYKKDHVTSIDVNGTHRVNKVQNLIPSDLRDETNMTN